MPKYQVTMYWEVEAEDWPDARRKAEAAEFEQPQFPEWELTHVDVRMRVED